MVDLIVNYVKWAFEFSWGASGESWFLFALYGVEIFVTLVFPVLAVIGFIVSLPFALILGWRTKT